MTTLDRAPTIALLSPASFAHGQPHDQFAWLRANDPVHWHPEPGADGFWVITRYGDVKAVGRDPATFSSSPTIMIEDGEAMDLGDHQMMLMADRPRHTGLRKVVAPQFIPRVAKSMRPRIEGLATRIIDAVAEVGACDLVTDVAGLMPSYVIADMLGLPLEDGVALYRLTEAIHAAPESQAPGAAMGAVKGVRDHDKREVAEGAMAAAIAAYLVESGRGHEVDLPRGAKLEVELERALYLVRD